MRAAHPCLLAALAIAPLAHARLAHAASPSLLFALPAAGTDGQWPTGTPGRDSSGNLYILTTALGTTDQGKLVEIAGDGVAIVLHTFTGATGPNTDGASPAYGVILDSAGDIFGVTTQGGTYGGGTVFEVSAAGKESILHAFLAQNPKVGKLADGATPAGGLARDSAGNLYGVTFTGGAHNGGTVYKLTPGGTETLLHSFANGTDGSKPNGVLALDSNDTLYGVVPVGKKVPNGLVYRLTQAGAFKALHDFAGEPGDGADPRGGLALGPGGELYGVTEAGGTTNLGTAFKLTTTGQGETLLHSFANSATDGYAPNAAPVLDSAGNLYGTTTANNAGNDGTVYKITQGGGETLLADFTANSIGYTPSLGLAIDAEASLYGANTYSGAGGFGTVYKITQ